MAFQTQSCSMKTKLPLLGLVGLLSWLPACSKPAALKPLSADAVAEVGGQVITRVAFQEELTRRGRLSADQCADPKVRQAVLEELICVEALHQKALAAGYDRDPEIAASRKRMIVAKYQADQLARLGQTNISAAAITNYYRNHPERFGTPERVRAALIEIKVARTALPEKRAELAKQAEAGRAEAVAAAAADGTFGWLAQQHSEAQASRYRGGDIGWFDLGQTNTEWPGAVMTALFQLTHPGEISPVIETPAAFYLVKVIEMQPARIRALAEVREGIAYLLAREQERQQQETLHAAAKQGLPIRINPALLYTIPAPTKPTPPAFPGVATTQARRAP